MVTTEKGIGPRCNYDTPKASSHTMVKHPAPGSWLVSEEQCSCLTWGSDDSLHLNVPGEPSEVILLKQVPEFPGWSADAFENKHPWDPVCLSHINACTEANTIFLGAFRDSCFCFYYTGKVSSQGRTCFTSLQLSRLDIWFSRSRRKLVFWTPVGEAERLANWEGYSSYPKAGVKDRPPRADCSAAISRAERGLRWPALNI